MLSASARAEIAAHLSKYPTKRSAIIPALHIAQREVGWLPDEVMADVAGLLDLQPTEVRAVAGFYSLYFKEKVGRHVIHFCNDLPCALRGADELMQKVCESLGIEPHGTTADGEFTLEPAMCLAACDKAPLMQIDLDYFENLTEARVDEILLAIRQGEIKLDRASVVRSEL